MRGARLPPGAWELLTVAGPVHPDFDGLLELLRDERDGDTPVVYHCDVEPDPATRRLMATLGVEVIVTGGGHGVRSIPVQELLTTRDCVASGCDQVAEPGTSYCRRHIAGNAARERAQGERSGVDIRRDVPAPKLLAAPAVEPKREDTKVDTDYRTMDANGLYGCKTDGCTGRARVNRGAIAYLCPEHALVKQKRVTAASQASMATARAKRSGGEPGPAVASAEARGLTASDPEPPASGDDAVAPPSEPPSEPVSEPEPPHDRPAVEADEPPGGEGDTAGSDSHAFAILDLLALIRDLDAGHNLDDGSLSVSRWSPEGSGDQDVQATALIRRLARAALDAADPALIGAAVLAQLDEAT